MQVCVNYLTICQIRYYLVRVIRSLILSNRAKSVWSSLDGLASWECIEPSLTEVVYDYCFVGVCTQKETYLWCYLIETRRHLLIRRSPVHLKVCSRCCGLDSHPETTSLPLALVNSGRVANPSIHSLLGVGSWKEGLVIFHAFDGNTEYLLEGT